MPRYSCVFLLGLLTTAFASQLSNRTIDDEYGDSVTRALPEYFNHWVQGADCDRCSINLNTAKLFRGTSHGTATSPNEETKSIPNITLRFTGVAIYVYNVLANRVPSADFSTDTRLTFTLDDTVDGHFQHLASDSLDFVFNHLVYAQSGLANRDHVLVIQPAAGSLCMFDYAEYTFVNQSTVSSSKNPPLSSPTSRTPPPSSTHYSSSTSGTGTTSSSSDVSPSATPYPAPQGSPKTDAVARTSEHSGAVVGGTIGGVVIFFVLLLVLWRYLRAKRRTVWSWLPPYECTRTEPRHTRTFSSREVLEGILHITTLRPRPSENRPSHLPSIQDSLPPAEDTEHVIEVTRDSRPSLPSLFPHQLISFRGLTASAEPCPETVFSPHTSVQVVVDGKLQLSDVGGRDSCPPSARSSTARGSFSQTSMTRSFDTTLNEEVLSQLVSLRAEVAGLRAQQEAQQRLMEAPPRYGEGM